jgi:hypothetical protein
MATRQSNPCAPLSDLACETAYSDPIIPTEKRIHVHGARALGAICIERFFLINETPVPYSTVSNPQIKIQIRPKVAPAFPSTFSSFQLVKRA